MKDNHGCETENSPDRPDGNLEFLPVHKPYFQHKNHEGNYDEDRTKNKANFGQKKSIRHLYRGEAPQANLISEVIIKKRVQQFSQTVKPKSQCHEKGKIGKISFRLGPPFTEHRIAQDKQNDTFYPRAQ